MYNQIRQIFHVLSAVVLLCCGKKKALLLCSVYAVQLVPFYRLRCSPLQWTTKNVAVYFWL